MACGGSSTLPDGAVRVEPLEVSVDATRQGGAVHLAVLGRGFGHGPGEAFEHPEQWVIKARASGTELKRVVNGSRSIDRQPVGRGAGNQWDVRVRFTVGYAVPDGIDKLELELTPPGDRKHKLEVDVE
jgi:hypothetical protein